MAKDIQKVIPVRPRYQQNRGAVNCESGLEIAYTAQAIYDTAGNDSSGVANTTIATHGLGVFLPIGAVISRAYYYVKTGFTSAGGNAGTIALNSNAAGDLLVAVAVSNAVLGTTGFKETLALGTAASMISLSAERELQVTVAGQVMTAGKLILYVEWSPGL